MLILFSNLNFKSKSTNAMVFPNMNQTPSQSSKQSNISAKSILVEIKRSTPKPVSREFFATLELLKRKQITAQQVQERVKEILKDYPHLIDRLDPAIKTPKQISPAFEFVTKIKETYQDHPFVYEQFTVLLRDYQRGVKTKLQVKQSVDQLLQDRPDLIEDFNIFYNEPKMVRNDSNDTLPEMEPVLTEAHPLLGDIETGVSEPTRSLSQKPWILFFSGMVFAGGIVTLYVLGYFELLWNFVLCRT
jgi:histone deacetylase complex regulatory component SIN3